MVTVARWKQAQATEPSFWAGMALYLPGLLKVLADNADKAQRIASQLAKLPQSCLEIGIGPFGIGIIGFLPGIEFRVGLDPADPVPLNGNAALHDYIKKWREGVSYIIATGEEVPLPSDSMDMVICCNVIDHAQHSAKILAEIRRVLRSRGLLYLDVDTFSVLGLIKWHTWTKYRFRNLDMVKAHTSRMFEPVVGSQLRAAGFEELHRDGHGVASLLMGHSRVSAFLAKKAK
ncbi:MAG: class I SAM-dependent methyltransferase [Candidatus Acidiferrales bacterium]